MGSVFLETGITSATLQVLLDRFSNFALKELGLLFGVDDDIRKLERTLLRIQVLVDDIESQHFINSNQAWQAWLQDIKSVSFDADDLLDRIDLELMRLNSNNTSSLGSHTQVRDIVFSSLKSLSIPHKLCEIQKRLDGMLDEVDRQFMIEIVKKKYPHSHSSSLVEESSVIGRDDDKRKIVEMLLWDGEGVNVDVISIVGMGGIGKTTLAKLVYNDADVVTRFNFRIWISVSVDYDVVRITKSIVESAMGKRLKFSELDPIQVTLQNILRGKRFLLVLDDMWNENMSDWDVLRSPFSVGLPGSKVLVTSRSSIVSTIVATTTDPYHLQPLSDEDCWELIAKRALLNRNVDGKEKLVAIGEKIAEKCEGIPLAAKTIGSVLRFKFAESEWEALLESKMWDFPEYKTEVFPALRLSYNYLPAPLKKCFAYCSIFPHNYEFEKDDLVHMWMAEGFIQPQGMKRIEDIGNDYFDNLFWRCFFYFSHVNYLDQHVYHMHGLIHELAQLVSTDICFQMEDGMSHLLPIYRNARHSSVLSQDIQPMTLQVFQRYRCLRTFMLFCRNGSHIVEFLFDLFQNLQCLRVLNLSSTGIFELPDSIENLKHLRYLNVSKTNIKKLPESIANLNGLETLKIQHCFNFLELPKHMKNLVKLRHLDLDIKRQLSSMPLELGKLTSLQTLHAFIVGKEEGCQIGEFQKLRNLRGRICITNLENVVNLRDAKEAMLDKKPYLDRLELQWNEFKGGLVEQEVLAGLQPHYRLKELQVTNYGGFMFPGWLTDPSLCKLVSICLESCQECKVLPPLGLLPALKSLHIYQMHGLVSVDHGFCGLGMNHRVKGFPSLESLTFHDMPNLEVWTGLNAEDMPHLCQLIVVDCPKLICLPSIHFLSSLQNLEISRCPILQSLPDEGLPDSLKALIILDSAILKERCRQGGVDWSKIRAIPKIEIDYVEIPLQGRDG
uniref:NB-ARC domain-containing protein n=1 Tax=Fagus sylvatica TaxID=28930 RepID=A0A2N9IDX3_FAGSY